MYDLAAGTALTAASLIALAGHAHHRRSAHREQDLVAVAVATGVYVPTPDGWFGPAPVEHHDCQSCGITLCDCPASLCDGTVDPGCGHGRHLCDEHRLDCALCCDDARYGGEG